MQIKAGAKEVTVINRMEILGTTGILVPAKDRPGRGGKNDFMAVVNWRGEDGYSEPEVQNLFGQWL